MNAPQIFDNFLDKIKNFSPRTKNIFAGGIVLLFILCTFSVYYVGKRAGAEKASAAFDKAESERMIAVQKLQSQAAEADTRAIIHRQNEKKFAQENLLLREQIELQAQVLRQNDTKIRVESQKKLDKIFEEKKQKIYEIENDTDFNSNVCALCGELRRANFKLSDDFCGKCQTGAK